MEADPMSYYSRVGEWEHDRMPCQKSHMHTLTQRLQHALHLPSMTWWNTNSNVPDI